MAKIKTPEEIIIEFDYCGNGCNNLYSAMEAYANQFKNPSPASSVPVDKYSQLEIINKGMDFSKGLNADNESYLSGAGYGYASGYEDAMKEFTAVPVKEEGKGIKICRHCKCFIFDNDGFCVQCKTHIDQGFHTEKIICPECEFVQDATVEHTIPWHSYVHECVKCKYMIMESEWNNPPAPTPNKQEQEGEVKPDCAAHETNLCGIEDMELMAEKIGNLHYQTLFNLLYYLYKKIDADAEKDNASGREKLAAALQYAGMGLFEAALRMEKVWNVSKPYMRAVYSTPPLPAADVAKMAEEYYPLDNPRKNMFHDNSGQISRQEAFIAGYRAKQI